MFNANFPRFFVFCAIVFGIFFACSTSALANSPATSSESLEETGGSACQKGDYPPEGCYDYKGFAVFLYEGKWYINDMLGKGYASSDEAKEAVDKGVQSAPSPSSN